MSETPSTPTKAPTGGRTVDRTSFNLDRRVDSLWNDSRLTKPGGLGMRKLCVVMLAMLIVAMPAMAGDKGTCDGNGEDCMKVMQKKLAHKAWLGIEYETDTSGHWVVESVVPNSPAQKAGFEAGDVMLAVNGVKYSKENKSELKAAYSKLEPGSSATYYVKRGEGKVKLQATLGSVPKDLQAKWINEHMEKYHPDMKMASK
jgi:hypothetical protein